MGDNNYTHALKLIPHMKKYVKKYPITGVIEKEQWFRFEYKITSIKFIDDPFEWNRHIEVNISCSERYWDSKKLCWIKSKNLYYWWSSVRARNKYFRIYGEHDIKQHFSFFSFPYRTVIKTIKVVD